MTTTPANIVYIADADVDESLDLDLRGLLSTCFTKPQDEVFKHRRYFHEPPAHRWLIRDERGALVAHLAAHERTLIDGERSYAVGGIAEVCVHPSHRGQGHVKALLADSQQWLSARGYAFAVLFGEPRYYASSGYVPVANMNIDVRDASGHLIPQRAEGALAASLDEWTWPQTGMVYLPGQYF